MMVHDSSKLPFRRKSTLKIIIAGCGKVGFTLAEHLSHEHHDVTILDNRDLPLQRAAAVLDVLCVKGNCTSVPTLEDAGAGEADVVIAATNSDEVNMLCCLCAKRAGAGHTIARVRGEEYSLNVNGLKQNLGIDTVINPEYSTAVEISRMLRFPSADNVDTFPRARVELVSFVSREGDFLNGRPISALPAQFQSLPVLLCAVERGGEVYIPRGSFVVQQGDKIYLIGQPSGINQFFKLLGRHALKIRSAFLVGGSRIAFYLTNLMYKMGIQCKIVERSYDRCVLLAEKLPHTMVIHGDGTDPDLLQLENLSSSDAFMALTDRDEDNLIISLYAMQMGIPKVVAKSNQQNYNRIAHSAGLQSVVSPKMITANQILQLVRGLQNSKGSIMTALYRIADGHAEAMEFEVNDTTRHLNTPLRELRLKKDIIIAIIIHKGKVIIPEGSSTIQLGDTIVLIARDQSILDINDIFADPLAGGGER